MKKSVKIFSLFMVLAGSASAAVALPGEPESEKTKSYTKTYPVGSNDRIVLNNSFGEMKISTWSKNEVKVDVTMTIKASTDERAQKLLDMISIEDGKSGSDISFKTHIDNGKRDGDEKDRNRNDRKGDRSDRESTSFKINYTVYLPANATLDATNQFGPMSIGDFDGTVTLISKFGSLTAGKLSHSKKVSIEFGKGNIESINNGKLEVKFSNAQINKLSGEITADIEQSHAVKINLDNGLKQIDIHNSFSQLYLDADKNLSANFTIHTSMGSFSNKSSFSVVSNQENEHRYYTESKTYTGKSGSGNIPVNVKSSFGKITLGHNLTIDVNDKDHHDDDDKDHKDNSDRRNRRIRV